MQHRRLGEDIPKHIEQLEKETQKLKCFIPATYPAEYLHTNQQQHELLDVVHCLLYEPNMLNNCLVIDSNYLHDELRSTRLNLEEVHGSVMKYKKYLNFSSHLYEDYEKIETFNEWLNYQETKVEQNEAILQNILNELLGELLGDGKTTGDDGKMDTIESIQIMNSKFDGIVQLLTKIEGPKKLEKLNFITSVKVTIYNDNDIDERLMRRKKKHNDLVSRYTDLCDHATNLMKRRKDVTVWLQLLMIFTDIDERIRYKEMRDFQPLWEMLFESTVTKTEIVTDNHVVQLSRKQDNLWNELSLIEMKLNEATNENDVLRRSTTVVDKTLNSIIRETNIQMESLTDRWTKFSEKAKILARRIDTVCNLQRFFSMSKQLKEWIVDWKKDISTTRQIFDMNDADDYLEEHRQSEKTLISKKNDIDVWKEFGCSFNIVGNTSLDSQEDVKNVSVQSNDEKEILRDEFDLIKIQIELIENDYEELLSLWNSKLKFIEQLKSQQKFIHDANKIQHSIMFCKNHLTNESYSGSLTQIDLYLNQHELFIDDKLRGLGEKINKFQQLSLEHETKGHFDHVFFKSQVTNLKTDFQFLSRLSDERHRLLQLFKRCRIGERDGNETVLWLNDQLMDFEKQSSLLSSQVDLEEKASQLNRLQVMNNEIDSYDVTINKLLLRFDELLKELEETKFYVNSDRCCIIETLSMNHRQQNSNVMEEKKWKKEKKEKKRYSTSIAPDISPLLRLQQAIDDDRMLFEKKKNEIKMKRNELLRERDHHHRLLSKQEELLNYFNQMQQVNSWLDERRFMLNMQDIGDDYEHCQELMHRLDVRSIDSFINDDQIELLKKKSLQLLSDEIDRHIREDIEQRLQFIIHNKEQIIRMMKNYHRRLKDSLQLHKLIKDAQELLEEINEKISIVSSINPEQFFKDRDIQTVQSNQHILNNVQTNVRLLSTQREKLLKMINSCVSQTIQKEFVASGNERGRNRQTQRNGQSRTMTRSRTRSCENSAEKQKEELERQLLRLRLTMDDQWNELNESVRHHETLLNFAYDWQKSLSECRELIRWFENVQTAITSAKLPKTLSECNPLSRMQNERRIDLEGKVSRILNLKNSCSKLKSCEIFSHLNLDISCIDEIMEIEKRTLTSCRTYDQYFLYAKELLLFHERSREIDVWIDDVEEMMQSLVVGKLIKSTKSTALNISFFTSLINDVSANNIQMLSNVQFSIEERLTNNRSMMKEFNEDYKIKIENLKETLNRELSMLDRHDDMNEDHHMNDNQLTEKLQEIMEKLEEKVRKTNDRYKSISDCIQLSKKAIQIAVKYQGFVLLHYEVEMWLSEKTQTLHNDATTTVPSAIEDGDDNKGSFDELNTTQQQQEQQRQNQTNLRSKMQRHLVLIAELNKNRQEIQKVNEEYEEFSELCRKLLPEDDGSSTSDLLHDGEEKANSLTKLFDSLIILSNEKKQLIQQSLSTILFLRNCTDFLAWVDDVEIQIQSSDAFVNKDYSVGDALQNREKHERLEQMVKEHQNVLDRLKEESSELLEDILISEKQKTDDLRQEVGRNMDYCQRRYDELEHPLNIRRNNLEELLSTNRLISDLQEEKETLNCEIIRSLKQSIGEVERLQKTTDVTIDENGHPSFIINYSTGQQKQKELHQLRSDMNMLTGNRHVLCQRTLEKVDQLNEKNNNSFNQIIHELLENIRQLEEESLQLIEKYSTILNDHVTYEKLKNDLSIFHEWLDEREIRIDRLTTHLIGSSNLDSGGISGNSNSSDNFISNLSFNDIEKQEKKLKQMRMDIDVYEEHELSEMKKSLTDVLESEHFARQLVFALNQNLDNRWKRVKSKINFQTDQLSSIKNILDFYSKIDLLECSLKDEQIQLSSDDYGDDAEHAENLLQRCELRKVQIEGMTKLLNELERTAQQLCESSYTPEMEVRRIDGKCHEAIDSLNAVQTTYDRRVELLNNSIRYLAFERDCEDIVSWLQIKRLTIKSQFSSNVEKRLIDQKFSQMNLYKEFCELRDGNDVEAIQILLRRHDALMRELATIDEQMIPIKEEANIILCFEKKTQRNDRVKRRMRLLENELGDLRYLSAVYFVLLVQTYSFHQINLYHKYLESTFQELLKRITTPNLNALLVDHNSHGSSDQIGGTSIIQNVIRKHDLFVEQLKQIGNKLNHFELISKGIMNKPIELKQLLQGEWNDDKSTSIDDIIAMSEAFDESGRIIQMFQMSQIDMKQHLASRDILMRINELNLLSKQVNDTSVQRTKLYNTALQAVELLEEIRELEDWLTVFNDKQELRFNINVTEDSIDKLDQYIKQHEEVMKLLEDKRIKFYELRHTTEIEKQLREQKEREEQLRVETTKKMNEKNRKLKHRREKRIDESRRRTQEIGKTLSNVNAIMNVLNDTSLISSFNGSTGQSETKKFSNSIENPPSEDDTNRLVLSSQNDQLTVPSTIQHRKVHSVIETSAANPSRTPPPPPPQNHHQEENNGFKKSKFDKEEISPRVIFHSKTKSLGRHRRDPKRTRSIRGQFAVPLTIGEPIIQGYLQKRTTLVEGGMISPITSWSTVYATFHHMKLLCFFNSQQDFNELKAICRPIDLTNMKRLNLTTPSIRREQSQLLITLQLDNGMEMELQADSNSSQNSESHIITNRWYTILEEYLFPKSQTINQSEKTVDRPKPKRTSRPSIPPPRPPPEPFTELPSSNPSTNQRTSMDEKRKKRKSSSKFRYIPPTITTVTNENNFDPFRMPQSIRSGSIDSSGSMEGTTNPFGVRVTIPSVDAPSDVQLNCHLSDQLNKDDYIPLNAVCSSIPMNEYNGSEENYVRIDHCISLIDQSPDLSSRFSLRTKKTNSNMRNNKKKERRLSDGHERCIQSSAFDTADYNIIARPFTEKFDSLDVSLSLLNDIVDPNSDLEATSKAEAETGDFSVSSSGSSSINTNQRASTMRTSTTNKSTKSKKKKGILSSLFRRSGGQKSVDKSATGL
ncbi:hypothetical protein SNEBB_000252 [Seison nebaliae]|nr:hypothetical protein SNEBB_000252 [Seison nebaliae]